MATPEQISERRQAGEDVRKVREDRQDHGRRSAEEVKQLREAAAETAAVCADCFTPLVRGASITQVGRWTHHTPASYTAFSSIPAADHYLDVPICLPCWLVSISTPWSGVLRGVPLRGRDADPFWFDKEVQRHRCEGCGRPMRVVARLYRRLTLRERCCCAQCLHKATLRRANQRRRVRHHEMACEVCGTMFVPRQSTARTCSNRCRQKLHRQRHKVVIIAVVIITGLALTLLHAPVQVQALEQDARATAMTAQAQPYPNPGDRNCASGYTSSGGFCRPIDERSAPAIANPGGRAQCPSGWTSSGDGCVRIESPRERDRRMGR